MRELVKYIHPDLEDNAIRRELGPGRFPANSASEIEASVDRLSREWRRALEGVNLGNEEVWAVLRAEKLGRVLRVADDDPRERAAQAFDEGRYEQAVALYERIPGELRRAEKKRLEIARRRAAQ